MHYYKQRIEKSYSSKKLTGWEADQYDLCKKRRNKLDKEVKNGTPRHLKKWMIYELNNLEKKLNQPE